MTGPLPPSSQPGSDPSMDDILASIRRILSEDEATPAAAPEASTPASAPPASAPDNDVLLLDTSMMVPEPTPATPPPVSPPASPPISPYASPLADTVNLPPPAEPTGTATADTLVGPATAAVAASSIVELVRTLSNDRGTQVQRNGPTIEDLVREEIRPLVKGWLDKHLGPLVERLVRAEIARVVDRAAP